MSQRCCVPEQDKPGFTGGAPCLPAVRLARSPCLFFNAGVALGRMAPPPPQPTWCGRPVVALELSMKGDRRGFTRQPENSKRAHFRAGLRKHHQNSTRRHPERDKKSENGAGEGKKQEILGLPPFGAPPFGAPPGLGPTFGAMTHTRSRIGLARIGLAKIGFGQMWPGQNQDGQNGIGQSRSLLGGRVTTNVLVWRSASAFRKLASRSAISSAWVCAASGEVTIAAATFEAAQSSRRLS